MDSTKVPIVQAALAGGFFMIYVLRKALPKGPWWTREFAKEEPWSRSKGWTMSTVALLLLCIIGYGLALASTIAAPKAKNNLDYVSAGLQPILFAFMASITLIDRPRKTPKTLLALFTTTALCITLSEYATYTRSGDVSGLRIGQVCVAIAAILVILGMPMRDYDLDNDGIAGPHDRSTAELRSPEDRLSLWKFMTVSWMAPLIWAGSEKRLDEEDVWLLPYEFQHSRLHTLFRDLQGSLIKRLMIANGLDLIIGTFSQTLETVAKLSDPVLLGRLLASIEAGPNNTKESIFYAVSILVVRIVACQSAVFSLWFGRRAYERSRGEMITTIYAKTLTRKSQGVQQGESDPSIINGNGLKGEQIKEGRVARLLAFLRLRKKRSSETAVETKPPATMGKILNLMRNDCYEVAQRFWEFPSLFTKPLQFILSLVLVWQLIGWPCLLGVAWVVIVQLLNAAFVRKLLARERLRRAATDTRLQATSQFVEAIRHLRWYDWQSKWLATIMDTRAAELHLKVITGLWTALISTINISAGALFPVASFFAYTYIAGKPLSVDIAFPALALFSMLETSLKELPDLLMVLLNASVAMGRLEAFMSEPDKEEGDSSESTAIIEFHDASFAWPGVHGLVLQNLDLSFPVGLTVVCGKVGSGKTALLQGILGELDRRLGDCILPDEMIGYCSQSPWLQHMSIRDNILFSAPYDPVRYKQVLDACALTPDLANFEHGDLSFIGENGIGLSGGQKARVALARAVYCQSRILLLDDPLAPLDHNTAESIVQKLFRGRLVEGRTVVLVTHRVDLITHLADRVVEIADGKANLLDPEDIPPQIVAAAASNSTGQADSQEEEAGKSKDDDAEISDKFIVDEHRRHGGIVFSVYWTYIKAGKRRWWTILIVLLAIVRVARLFNTWFLKAFSEAYSRVASSATDHGIGIQEEHNRASGLFDRLPSPNDDVGPWLIWYTGIALGMTLLYGIYQCFLLLIMYTAAKDMFARAIKKVGNATFRFYDVTPIGRLMNRLTSDIGMLDGGIVAPLQNMAFFLITWVTCLVVIASATPTFCLFAMAMTAGFVYFFMKFLPTSQSLRRLEMVSLSPLMSNFGILLDGLATIRAFKAQPNFQNRNIVVTDQFQQKDHFFWSLQAWLMYRFDILSAISIFILTLIAVFNGLSPGLTAFVLLTAAQFVEATHALCRVYGQLQMDFLSVERVVELLDIEEEKSGDIEPPASWPGYSDDIIFDSVTMKYAPHLEPSLSDVTFTIPGGSTCAVLGRTGSGKSTLALALLATLHPEKGHIKVGEMDISKVNVHTWRQRISFVAQDPVLFPGTLRQNLDPLKEHTDDECIAVLHRILGPEWSLSSHVDGGGKNLSQGQRQLVGIGRAVLRRSPVVVLDEATASIDKKTALAIQDVLRDELKESTVITIAHRLEAVKDADYYIRLDAGRVVESGPANNV